MDLSMEITNCGLIALRNICDFKNISAKTLISLASDNGTTLVAYKVPVNKIKEIELPAIFQSTNHFFYVGENEVLPEIEYTGVVLSNKDLKKISVENGELKNINGGTVALVAVGVGAATAIYGAAEAKAADDRARQERRDALERQRLAEIAYKAEQAAAQARAAAAAKAEAERQSKLMGVLFGKKGGAGTQGGGGISKPLIIVGVSVLGLGVVAVILVLIFKK